MRTNRRTPRRCLIHKAKFFIVPPLLAAWGCMIALFPEQAMVRLLTLLLVSISANALAYDSDGVKTHFGLEIAECAAYYTIAAEISNRFGNVPAGMALQRNADRAMEMGRMLNYRRAGTHSLRVSA